MCWRSLAVHPSVYIWNQFPCQAMLQNVLLAPEEIHIFSLETPPLILVSESPFIISNKPSMCTCSDVRIYLFFEKPNSSSTSYNKSPNTCHLFLMEAEFSIMWEMQNVPWQLNLKVLYAFTMEFSALNVNSPVKHRPQCNCLQLQGSAYKLAIAPRFRSHSVVRFPTPHTVSYTREVQRNCRVLVLAKCETNLKTCTCKIGEADFLHF